MKPECPVQLDFVACRDEGAQFDEDTALLNTSIRFPSLGTASALLIGRA